MKFSRLLFSSVVVAGASLAMAQSDSFFDSINTFTFGLGADVTNTYDSINHSGRYQNFTASTTGDGINDGAYNFEYMNTSGSNLSDGQVEASADSYSNSNGTATQFNGENYSLDFTNNSKTQVETFSITENADEYLTASAAPFHGYSLTNAYVGWQIYDAAASFPIGYFGMSVDSNGVVQSNSTADFTVTNTLPNEYFATGGITYNLNPGETLVVQIWASGSTQVQAVPEPTTIGLGLALLGGLIRRKKIASS